jgi:hypothetical protein
MLAKVIKSEKNKKRITCDKCGLSYTAGEYSILFKNKKLVYFRLKMKDARKTTVLCHGCLFDLAGSLAGDKNFIRLKIIDGDTK